MKDISLFLSGWVILFLGSAITLYLGSWYATLLMVVIGISAIILGWKMYNTVHVYGNLRRET